MHSVKLKLTRSEWEALARLTARLNVRLPLEHLRTDATAYALATLCIEVGFKALLRFKRMEFGERPRARLLLSQAEALAFFALWESGEFSDWPPESFEYNFIASLCRHIHQKYALNP